MACALHDVSSSGAGEDRRGPPTAPADPMPEPPLQPEPEDCCGSGCARCVFDLYEDARERYDQALREWQARHEPRD
jgi:hypothetical protein